MFSSSFSDGYQPSVLIIFKFESAREKVYRFLSADILSYVYIFLLLSTFLFACISLCGYICLNFSRTSLCIAYISMRIFLSAYISLYCIHFSLHIFLCTFLSTYISLHVHFSLHISLCIHFSICTLLSPCIFLSTYISLYVYFYLYFAHITFKDIWLISKLTC